MVTDRMLPVSTKDLWREASIPVARVLLQLRTIDGDGTFSGCKWW